MKTLLLSLSLFVGGSAAVSAPAAAPGFGGAGYAEAAALMLPQAAAQCTPEQINAAINRCISQRCSGYPAGSYNFHTCVSYCSEEGSRNCS